MDGVAEQFGKGLADLAALLETKLDAKLAEHLGRFEGEISGRLEKTAKAIADREHEQLEISQRAIVDEVFEPLKEDLEQTKEVLKQESMLVVEKVCEKLDSVQAEMLGKRQQEAAQEAEKGRKTANQAEVEQYKAVIAQQAKQIEGLEKGFALSHEKLKSELEAKFLRQDAEVRHQIASSVETVSSGVFSLREEQKEAKRLFEEHVQTVLAEKLEEKSNSVRNKPVDAAGLSERQREHVLQLVKELKLEEVLERKIHSELDLLQESVELEASMQKNRVDALERLVRNRKSSASGTASTSSSNKALLGAAAPGDNQEQEFLSEPDRQLALVSRSAATAANGGNSTVQDAKALLESTLAVREAKVALQNEGARINTKLLQFDEKEARLRKEVESLRAEFQRLQSGSDQMSRTVAELQRLGETRIKDLQTKVQQAVTPRYPGMPPPGPAGGVNSSTSQQTTSQVAQQAPAASGTTAAVNQTQTQTQQIVAAAGDPLSNTAAGNRQITMQQTTTYSTNYNVGAAPVVGYTPAGHLVPTLHQPFLVRPPAGAQPATTVSDADYLQALYRNLELQTPQVPQLQLLLGDVEQKQDYANDLNVQTTNYNSRSPGTTTSAVLGYLNKGEGLQESNLERKPAGVVLPNATTTKTNYDYEVVNQNPYVMNTTQTALQPVRGPQSYLQQTPGGADDTGGCGVQ